MLIVVAVSVALIVAGFVSQRLLRDKGDVLSVWQSAMCRMLVAFLPYALMLLVIVVVLSFVLLIMLTASD